MAKIQHVLLAVLTTQVCVNSAPSDVTKLKEIAKVNTAELEAKPTLLEETNLENSDAAQGQRQKRWYDFGGFGFPPPISPAFPFVKRDESINTGVYGLVDDPLTHVYRRLQNIASVARQPSFPPALPPSFPIYLPVLYLPQPCNCNPQQGNKNGSQPDSINTRFPEMDDTRQNWGYVVDDDEDNDDGQDASRPINFDSIRPNSTITRKPPPVEHGTVQGDGTLNSIGSVGPTPPPRQPPPTTRRPPQNVPKQTPINELPTNCDAAVLSCCHRPEITFECFTTQGCPDVASYGNPCEPSVILKVIERFQKFYLQRTG